MATVQAIITKVYERLSLGAGLDVQTYADSKVLAMLQHKFDVLFDSLYWPAYTTVGEEFTLDGVAGRVTEDLSAKIKRFEDIHSIYYENEASPLPNSSLNVNPRLIRRRGILPDATKVFRVVPATTTGTVIVTYRTKPELLELTSNTDIALDATLLYLGVCYDFIVDDDSNEKAAMNFKQQFDARFTQLKNLQTQFGLLTENVGSTNYITEWS